MRHASVFRDRPLSGGGFGDKFDEGNPQLNRNQNAQKKLIQETVMILVSGTIAGSACHFLPPLLIILGVVPIFVLMVVRVSS